MGETGKMSVAVAYASFAESDKKVAIVTIDRPEALNALTWSMLQQLAAAFRDIDATASAVILTGKGRSFSAGIDLTAASEVFTRDESEKIHDVVWQMERCEVPIIGAINVQP